MKLMKMMQKNFKKKLIDVRKPNYILSMKVAEILDKKADYINKKGSSPEEIAQKILKKFWNDFNI